MRGFIVGVIVAVVLLFVAVLLIAQFGLFPTRADATPPAFERRIAMSALDASMDRHAPRLTNPVAATDQNLIDGVKLYSTNCAACHGGLDYKPSVLEHSMYPQPPQLILDPMDDPEWHIYYAVQTGVRYTGMPAWNHVLADQDIWKITAFLSRVEKLPPAVQQFIKTTYGASPESQQGEQREHEHHGGHEHH